MINMEFDLTLESVEAKKRIQDLQEELTKTKQSMIIITLERLRLESIINQTQKIESIGQLTGGIAHDFNNILTVIKGYAELAQSNLNDAPTLAVSLEQILKSSEIAENLIRQLLIFSKTQELSLEISDVNSIITNFTETILRPLIGTSIKISLELLEELHPILADRIQLEQILINLCINARDAINEVLGNKNKKITIRTSNFYIDSNSDKLNFGIDFGQYILIEVSDTGIGMKPETKSRLFEPFFTTKPLGKGTGLGLVIIYGIIKQSHGAIYVYSEEGQGSTFKIYWPAIVNDDVLSELPANKEDFISKRGTLLFVEDDSDLRKVMSLSLRSKGFTIFECEDGQDALQKLIDIDFQVDLIVMDVHMPNMTGIELANSIKKMNKHIRFLFSSGFMDEMDDPELINDNKANYLVKPYRIKDLLLKIEFLLSLENP